MHAVYFHDLDFLEDGNRQDTIPLYPGASFTFITKAGNVGTYVYCHPATEVASGVTQSLFGGGEGADLRLGVSQEDGIAIFFVAQSQMGGGGGAMNKVFYLFPH